MRIKELIGKITHYIVRNKILTPIPKISKRSIGGKYWKMLKSHDQQTYLKLTYALLQPNDSDEHIGDASFQNTIIGSEPEFVNYLALNMSVEYLKGEAFDFPSKLNASIETSKSSYNPILLMENTAKYLIGTSEEDRHRRYKDGNLIRYRRTKMRLSKYLGIMIRYGMVYNIPGHSHLKSRRFIFLKG
jgi:hypothetical protein